MLINKNTKIFCSFSKNPGNNGCIFFNETFQKNNINAIYRSFFSDNIKKSIEAVRVLSISGFAVSMPFKTEVLNYVDEVDEVVKAIGSCNTVINKGGKLIAYNTDWIGIKNYFLQTNTPSSIILAGNGGFSKAAQYTFDIMDIPYKIVTRNNWSSLKTTKTLIFNATPVDIITDSNIIDARPTESEGKIIARLQAQEQYKLYVNE